MLHLNFQGDRLEAPIFLFGMTSVGGFLFILGRYTDLQPLMILQHFQNQRYQRYHRRRFFLDWGWWEKHRIEIRNGGFFRFRRLTKSCVQLVTRMHIHSNMFKHHQLDYDIINLSTILWSHAISLVMWFYLAVAQQPEASKSQCLSKCPAISFHLNLF